MKLAGEHIGVAVTTRRPTTARSCRSGAAVAASPKVFGGVVLRLPTRTGQASRLRATRARRAPSPAKRRAQRRAPAARGSAELAPARSSSPQPRHPGETDQHRSSRTLRQRARSRARHGATTTSTFSLTWTPAFSTRPSSPSSVEVLAQIAHVPTQVDPPRAKCPTPGVRGCWRVRSPASAITATPAPAINSRRPTERDANPSQPLMLVILPRFAAAAPGGLAHPRCQRQRLAPCDHRCVHRWTDSRGQSGGECVVLLHAASASKPPMAVAVAHAPSAAGRPPSASRSERTSMPTEPRPRSWGRAGHSSVIAFVAPPLAAGTSRRSLARS